MLEEVNEIQEGSLGHIVEIGVHHGKFFLVLASCQRENEWAFAVDVFERQDENVSKSGNGSLPIFADNMASILPDATVCILKENSLRLDPKANIFTTNGMGVRLFSIDGGHSYHEALNDLIIADSVLTDNGVIIIDDFQHGGWDEVNAASMDFLKDYPYTPIAMGGNKLFVCKNDAAHLYKDLPTMEIDAYINTARDSIWISQDKVRAMAEAHPNMALFSDYHFVIPGGE